MMVVVAALVSSVADSEGLGRYIFKQQKADELLIQRNKLIEQQQHLNKQVAKLEEMIRLYDEEVAKTNKAAADLQYEKMQLQSFSGTASVVGPGVEITLNDRNADELINDPYMLSNFIVHDIDLLQVVNELKIVGAEAIAINGTRMVETSRISCGGPVISVGDKDRFAPPFIITAIGDQEAIIDYFNSDQSIRRILLLFGLECSIEEKEEVHIPAYMGAIEYEYAMPLVR